MEELEINDSVSTVINSANEVMFLTVFVCLSVCKQDYTETTGWIIMTLDGRMRYGSGKSPSNFGVDRKQGILLSLSLKLRIFFTFSLIFQRIINGWKEKGKIWHVQRTDYSECVQPDAEPNNNLDLVHLNVVSKGDCWALAEVWTLWELF